MPEVENNYFLKDDDLIVRIGQEQLPDWAIRVAEPGEITLMQQLYTKDGSRHGNAVMAEVSFKNNEVHFTAVTEAGNVIRNMNKSELDEFFTPGKWVMKDWPTTESKKAWYERKFS